MRRTMLGRTLRQVGGITVCLTVALLGCHKSAVQKKEPPDPLLITKKPVEGRSHPGEDMATVQNDTPPPVRWNDPFSGKPQPQQVPPGRPILVDVGPAPDGPRQ